MTCSGRPARGRARAPPGRRAARPGRAAGAAPGGPAGAQGGLLQTVKLDVDGRPLGGEFLQSATIVNTMIKQLGVFTSEVTRVAREVGTEGTLGGQAPVPQGTGVWKDLTESVNS